MTKQTVELVQTPDYRQIKQNFLDELVNASHGKPSCISFLKHHLPKKPLLTQGIVQGIVIGGTNFIVATEEIKTNGSKTIIEQKSGILPIFDTRQTFIDFISEQIDGRAEAVGINFGFPLSATTGSQNEIDGKLIRITKEHTFKGLLGEPLGALVKSLFQEKFKRTTKVSLANDTVCLALSGDGSEAGALITGTGFNMGLTLREADQKIIVNLESGNFNKFPLSPILQKIDSESELPGGQLLEKTVSGKYLALYFNEKIKELHLPIDPISSSQELSELSQTNHTDVAGDLARAIIERSAFLVASTIAGSYEFMGEPKSYTLIGEGSLLWNGWHYQENIQKQLDNLGIPSGTITIKHIKDSSLNGAFGLITK